MKVNLNMMLILSAFSIPAMASSDAAMSGTKLDSCLHFANNTHNQKANLCKLYIKGFIDNIKLNGGKVYTSATSTFSEAASGYLARAFKTRVGLETASNMGGTKAICFAPNQSMNEVYESLSPYLSAVDSEAQLPNRIKQALIEQYPCKGQYMPNRNIS